MAINRIFARSPFIIEVNELGQSGSKIELFFYRFGQTAPTLPTYTLSKLIPASNNLQNLYNISPYCKEYLTHPSVPNNYNTNNSYTNINEYVLCDVKRYKKVGVNYILLNTTTYYAYDGFGYYDENFNPQHSDIHLEQGNYYFWSSVNNNPSVNPLEVAGTITAYLTAGSTVKYKDLQTGAVNVNNILTTRHYNLFRVFPTSYLHGNKVQIYNPTLVLLWEGNFYPQEECLYTPVTIDFVNKYGFFQREYFFKASFENLNAQTTEYNFMQPVMPNYSDLLNQRQTFNTNGLIGYKINTGWVDEVYNETMQQILLSERILLDNKPVKLKTQSLNKEKNINNKKINYSLEIESSTDLINNVI